MHLAERGGAAGGGARADGDQSVSLVGGDAPRRDDSRANERAGSRCRRQPGAVTPPPALRLTVASSRAPSLIRSAADGSRLELAEGAGSVRESAGVQHLDASLVIT